MKIALAQTQTAILFAIFFILVGFLSPIAYVNVAPDSHFVEVHEFSAEDSYLGAEQHDVCFNRTVHRQSDAEITVELVLLRNDGIIVEEDSFNIEAYFQKGAKDVTISRELDTEKIEAGTYKYVHSVELSYYNGRVDKQFVFESEQFNIYNSKKKLQKNGSIGC